MRVTASAAPRNEGSFASTPVATGANGLGAGGGLTAGGFEPDQCTGYADQRRPDIHAYAVSHGVQAGGWNGNMWGVLAASAGLPTGSAPAAGAIASFQGGAYGHVAYVESVNPDGSYIVSEENYGSSEWNAGWEEPGYPDAPDPSIRTIYATPPGTIFIYGGPAGGGSPGGGSPGGGTPGGGTTEPGIRAAQTPAVVARTAENMDVFFTGTGGQLVNEFWGASTGWHQQVLAAGAAGSPTVVARNPTHMDVFFRSSSGQLVNEFWDASSGWNQQVLASGMASDPTVVARTPTNMDVFYTSTGGQLVNEFWGASTGWHQQVLAAGVAGSPAVVARYETSMDVFVRSTGGGLINEFWGASTGWNQQTLASGMSSDAAVVARTPANMDVFYTTPGGQLINEFWGANTGWNQQGLP